MNTKPPRDGKPAPAHAVRSALSASISGDALLRVMNSAEDKLHDELLIASEKGDAMEVQTLLKRGASPHIASGRNGFTPLHHACQNEHVPTAKLLLRSGASVNSSSSSSKETPLHLASYAGNLALVELLLDQGGDQNAQNEYGETALFYAARRGQPAIVRLLLQRGADPDIASRFGERAVEECLDKRTRSVFEARVQVQTSASRTKASAAVIIYQTIFQEKQARRPVP